MIFWGILQKREKEGKEGFLNQNINNLGIFGRFITQQESIML